MSKPGARSQTDQDSVIGTHEDAALVCAQVEATMEALLQLIEAESTLLRTGKLIAAEAIEPRKSEYARAHMRDLDLLRRVGPQLEYWAPEAVERLRQSHAAFMSVLQINMAALATARAASDSAARSIAAGLASQTGTWQQQAKRPTPNRAQSRSA